MTGRSGLFANSIGRRLLALFVAAAFVPIGAMMVLAFTRVNAVQEDVLQLELTQAAKAYGLSVFDRLTRLDDQLKDPVVEEALRRWNTPELAGHLGRDFTGVALFSNSGVLVRQHGSVPNTVRPEAGASARLADGKTLLAYLPGRQGHVLLMRALRVDDRTTQIVVAAANQSRLWGSPDTYPAKTDFCVVTASGALIHCSRPLAAAPDWTRVARDGGAPWRWEEADQILRANSWSLFTESRFTGSDWIVLAIQPEDHALRATHSFRASFVPVGLLALLVVALVSLTQIRRFLVPVRKLLEGTVRLTGHDFSTRIDIAGRDEFSQVAAAFNAMASRLGLQFRTFAAFAEIDRTILTTLDLRDVAATATRCLREIAAVDIVAVALVEPGSNRLRLFCHCTGTGDSGDRQQFDCEPGAILAQPALQWTDDLPLAPEFVAMLKASGARKFALAPVARGRQFAGVVVFGHHTSAPFAADAATQIAGVVDRLAIAVAAAARDKKLHDQAHFDGLTGLPNRYYLLSLVEQSLARAQRDKGRVAVLFVDLDNFKRINDTLGHAAGDRLLQAAATRIRGAVREGDTVARLGGDEFTVVLDPLGEPQAAGSVAQCLIDVLSEPFEVEGQEMYLGASIGIAVFPNDGATAEELLKQADTAMYRAKAMGRSSYAFFEDRMNTEASERARIDRELRVALQRGELVLHYQPLLDLRNGRLDSAEALVRWQHPQRGLLGPATFIPIAEESGLIEVLGTWVLEQACAQIAAWRAEGINLDHVSVNASVRQLQRPDFVGRVAQVLARTNLPPEALVVEVTESLFTDTAAVQILSRLQELGVRIAIDDFGTGYSSFAYLRSLPMSILKVDRSLIVDVATSRSAATVAGAIIKMAQALGKDVVAEGVETSAQIEFLESAGCEHIQGYAISQPVDAAAFRRLVHDHAARVPAEVETYLS